MSRRQAYWQDLRIIHSATGIWMRRMSFQAASCWVYAYTAEIRTGYEQTAAVQRAYDGLVYNKHCTLVSKGELQWAN